jgi:hypothetical protein
LVVAAWRPSGERLPPQDVGEVGAMVLERIGVLSLGKISGAIYAALGLIVGAFFALFSIVGSGFAAAASQESSPLLGMLFGVGAIVLLPLFYGVLGFLMGLVTAAIYNVVARVIGGLELELH